MTNGPFKNYNQIRNRYEKRLIMKLSKNVFLVLFMIFSINVYSAEKVKIIISTGYPPYYYFENDKPTGLCIEIVNSVFSRMDMEIEYLEYPWARCLQNMEDGMGDAILPIMINSERSEFMSYLPENILAYEENALFSKNTARITYSGNLHTLSPYNIGVVRGFSYGEDFDNATFLQKDTANDDEKLIKKLNAGRNELIIGNSLVIKYQAKKLGLLDQIKELEPGISRDPLYLAFLIDKKHDSVQKYQPPSKGGKQTPMAYYWRNTAIEAGYWHAVR